jgi:hypothetical protein
MRFDLCDHCTTKDNIKSPNKSRGQSVLKSLHIYEIMVNRLWRKKRHVSQSREHFFIRKLTTDEHRYTQIED